MIPATVVGGVCAIAAIRYWILPAQWLARARQAASSHDWAMADRYLARHIWLSGRSVDVLLLEATIDAERGRLADPIRRLAEVPRDHPQAMQANFYRAQLLLQLNRAAEAEQAAKAVIERHRFAIAARRLLFEIYSVEGRRLEAHELIEEVFHDAPDEVKVVLLSDLFRVDYDRGDPVLIAERLRSFLAADPKDADALAALGKVSADSGQFQRAKSQCERALRVRADQIEARHTLARCALQLGDPEQLKHLLDDWPAEPRDYRFFAVEASSAQLTGDHARARQGFERALQQTPDDWQLRSRLAKSLDALGETEPAEQQRTLAERLQRVLGPERIARLSREVLSDLDSADHRFELGLFYEELGYPQSAREWYRQVLNIDPNHRATQEALERLDAQRTHRS